jgi:hypothetical protein
MEAAGVELPWSAFHEYLGLFPLAQRRSIRSNRHIQVRNRYSSTGTHFTDYVALYHHERNHQGIANALIAGAPATSTVGRIRRRLRPGGVLNYCERAA